jgi:hypothetical protein
MGVVMGVRPGAWVLKEKGVFVANPLSGAIVANPPKVEVGTGVFVVVGVGGTASAVWVCWDATWVRTSLKAFVWIAAGSSVGGGVAPRLQALKRMAGRIIPTSQMCFLLFMITSLQ